jgi:hypothetical protein
LRGEISRTQIGAKEVISYQIYVSSSLILCKHMFPTS